MGLFGNKKNLINIAEDDLHDAKLSSLDFSDENTKKRAFINVLGARLAMKLLFSKKIEANNLYSMYTIHNILKEFDLADIYYQSIKIDVRLVFNEDEIFIPRAQFEYDILPHVYLILALKEDLSSAEMIGYFEPSELDKSNCNKEYYFIEKTRLHKADDFKSFLKKYPAPNKLEINEDDLNDAKLSFLSLVDKEISPAEKTVLLKNISNSFELRSSLVEFENFEIISEQAANNESMVQDGILGIVGTQDIAQIEEEDLNIKTIDLTGEESRELSEKEAKEKDADSFSGLLKDTSGVITDAALLGGAFAAGAMTANVASQASAAADGISATADLIEGVANIADSFKSTSFDSENNLDTPFENPIEFESIDEDLEESEPFEIESIEELESSDFTLEHTPEETIQEAAEFGEDFELESLTEEIEETGEEQEIPSETEEEIGLEIEDATDYNLDNLLEETEQIEAIENIDEIDEIEEISTQLLEETVESQDLSALDELIGAEFAETDLSAEEETEIEIENNIEELISEELDEDNFEQIQEEENVELTDENSEEVFEGISQESDDSFGSLSELDEFSNLEVLSDIEEPHFTLDNLTEEKDEPEHTEEEEEEEEEIINLEESQTLETEVSADLEEDASEIEVESPIEEFTLTELEPINLAPLESIDEITPIEENVEQEESTMLESEEKQDDLVNLDNFDFSILNEDEENNEIKPEPSKLRLESEVEAEEDVFKFVDEAEEKIEEDTTQEESNQVVSEPEHKEYDLLEEEDDSEIEAKLSNHDIDDITSQVDELLGQIELSEDIQYQLSDELTFEEEETSETKNDSEVETITETAKDAEPVFSNEIDVENLTVEDALLDEDKDLLQSLFEKEKITESSNDQFDAIAHDKSDKKSINKKTIIAASVAGAMLVTIAIGTISHNANTTTDSSATGPVPPISSTTTQPTDQGLDNLQTPDAGMPTDQANQMPLSAEDTKTANATKNRDMGAAVSDAFLSEPINPSVSKVAWEVPEDLAYNDAFRKYLQTAGKNIKLTLQNDLLLSTELAYSNKVIVDISLDKSGSLKSSDIILSSGSKQIDGIVLQSVKETLKYLKLPTNELNSPSIDATLIINF